MFFLFSVACASCFVLYFSSIPLIPLILLLLIVIVIAIAAWGEGGGVRCKTLSFALFSLFRPQAGLPTVLSSFFDLIADTLNVIIILLTLCC